MNMTTHLIEVRLKEQDDFKIVVETLTRIGIASTTGSKLLQICFLLHKQGRYFLCHYKELYALDGFDAEMSATDVARRNSIIALLNDWHLLTVVSPERIANPRADPKDIRILRHSDKEHWELIPKYEIGRKRRSCASARAAS